MSRFPRGVEILNSSGFEVESFRGGLLDRSRGGGVGFGSGSCIVSMSMLLVGGSCVVRGGLLDRGRDG